MPVLDEEPALPGGGSRALTSHERSNGILWGGDGQRGMMKIEIGMRRSHQSSVISEQSADPVSSGVRSETLGSSELTIWRGGFISQGAGGESVGVRYCPEIGGGGYGSPAVRTGDERWDVSFVPNGTGAGVLRSAHRWKRWAIIGRPQGTSTAGKAPPRTLFETPEDPEWVCFAISQSAGNEMVTRVENANYRVGSKVDAAALWSRAPFHEEAIHPGGSWPSIDPKLDGVRLASALASWCGRVPPKTSWQVQSPIWFKMSKLPKSRCEFVPQYAAGELLTPPERQEFSDPKMGFASEKSPRRRSAADWDVAAMRSGLCRPCGAEALFLLLPWVTRGATHGYSNGIPPGCIVVGMWKVPGWECGFKSQDIGDEMLMSSECPGFGGGAFVGILGLAARGPAGATTPRSKSTRGEEDGIAARAGDEERGGSFVPDGTGAGGLRTTHRWKRWAIIGRPQGTSTAGKAPLCTQSAWDGRLCYVAAGRGPRPKVRRRVQFRFTRYWR